MICNQVMCRSEITLGTFLYFIPFSTSVLLIRMVENLVQIFVSLQTLACVWYGIACPGAVCSEDSWVGDRENTGIFHRSLVFVLVIAYK